MELGIIYNDQLWDAVNLWVNEFNLETDSLKPRKRPMSLASPSIITDSDGNVRMVIGAAGGKYIATALSQVNNALHSFFFNKNIFYKNIEAGIGELRSRYFEKNII